MSNSFKGKVYDFLIIAAIYFLIAFSAFACCKLLYTERSDPKDITFISEVVSEDYKDLISVGDEIYDTITKRSIGQIEKLDILDTGAGIRFKFTVFATRAPKGEGLRTASLWLRCARL